MYLLQKVAVMNKIYTGIHIFTHFVHEIIYQKQQYKLKNYLNFKYFEPAMF